MPALFAEKFNKELGGSVNYIWLLREIRSTVHEPVNAYYPFDPVKITNCIFQDRNKVYSSCPCSLFGFLL